MDFDLRELLEHVPAVICRFKHQGDNWDTLYITENISMFGYRSAEF